MTMNGDDGWNPFEDERRAEMRARVLSHQQEETVGVKTMGKSFEHVHLVCTCLSTDHIIEFVANHDPEDPDVFWVNVQLRPARWYYRLWKGLKYIFGYTCVYGHWDSGSFDEDESRKLMSFMDANFGRRELRRIK